MEWLFCTIALLSVAARLYVRYHVAKLKTQVEDWFVIFGAIFFVAWVCCDTYSVSQGFMDNNKSYLHGAFSEQIKGDDNNKQRVLKVIYASSVPYYLNLWMVKFALLGFYYRLVPRGGYLRKFLWLTISVCIAMIIVIVFINLFLCQPISLNWALNQDPADPATCYSSTAVNPFIIGVVTNFVTDVAIFIIPFPLLPQLQLAGKQKLALCLTFSLGAITIIVCIARAIAIAVSGNIAQVAILTAMECSTAMLVASLPAMRVLLKQTVRKTTNSQSRSRGTPPGSAGSGSRGSEKKNNWFGLRIRNFAEKTTASEYSHEDLEMSAQRYSGPNDIENTYYEEGSESKHHLFSPDSSQDMTQFSSSSPDSKEGARVSVYAMEDEYLSQPPPAPPGNVQDVEYARQVAQRFEDPLQPSSSGNSAESEVDQFPQPTEHQSQLQQLQQQQQAARMHRPGYVHSYGPQDEYIETYMNHSNQF